MSTSGGRTAHQDGEELGLPLGAIKTNLDTQSRDEMNQATVDEYAEKMQAGAVFPPLTVFHDGQLYILADGYHRLHAARKLQLAEIRVKVRNGGRLDAVLYAAGANDEHGLPRTNADKRKAVRSLLVEKAWADKSDHWIAEQSRVSPPLVGKMRKELGEMGLLPRPKTGNDAARLKTVFSGKDGRTINTTNIGGKGGRKPKAPLQKETPVRPEPKPEPVIEHKQPQGVPLPADPEPNFDDLRLLVMDKAKVGAHRGALADLLEHLATHVRNMPCAS